LAGGRSSNAGHYFEDPAQTVGEQLQDLDKNAEHGERGSHDSPCGHAPPQLLRCGPGELIDR
jgi:hypothetical protein